MIELLSFHLVGSEVGEDLIPPDIAEGPRNSPAEENGGSSAKQVTRDSAVSKQVKQSGGMSRSNLLIKIKLDYEWIKA